MSEQENHNLDTVATMPIITKWNKWKLLAIINSIAIVGIAIGQIIYIQKINSSNSKTFDLATNNSNRLLWLESVNPLYNATSFHLNTSVLQIVNGYFDIKIIKAEPYLDSQKLTIGILNTSGVTQNNIKMKISIRGNMDGIELFSLDEIPSGFMRQTTIVLPKEYLDKDLQVEYVESSASYRLLP